MNIPKVQRLLLASMLFDMPLCLLPELILHWTYAEISLQKCFSKGKPIDLCSCIPHIWVRTDTNWRERREKNLRKTRRKRKEKRKKGRKEGKAPSEAPACQGWRCQELHEALGRGDHLRDSHSSALHGCWEPERPERGSWCSDGHSLPATLISSTYLHPINQVKEFASTYEPPSLH